MRLTGCQTRLSRFRPQLAGLVACCEVVARPRSGHHQQCVEFRKTKRSGRIQRLISSIIGVGRVQFPRRAMIDAILWDNDGVLVDTEYLFFESTRRTLARVGIELTLDTFLDLSMRQGRSVFELIIDTGSEQEQIARLKYERDYLYSEMLRRDTRVLPGVEETLGELHGRVRMAVVTSSQRVHFDAAHAQTGLIGYFEFVLTREDYRETKPNPEPYLLALDRLGMKADTCLVVEDSERGLASALAAGLRCIVIPNNLTRNCSFRGAAAILPGAADLLDALASL